jgi:glycosyltransferase involved in cell wall biosynthesis
VKLAISFGPYCCPSGFDHSRIWEDGDRALSGSDLGVYRMSQEASALGHEVHVFTFAKPGTNVPEVWEGISLHPFEHRFRHEFDAFVCWNECDPLIGARARLRVCSLQINSIVGNPVATDLWLSPSEWHRRRLSHLHQAPWEVVPDGADTEPFDLLAAHGLQKEPGRVIWTSSPDRGLHWLLQEWPMIRKAVPHATLRVFYPIDGWLDRMAAVTSGPPDIIEQKTRADFIRKRRPVLEQLGVELRGGVSRVEITKEIAAAECLAYSCDPTIPTEGFSCSVMECAAARSCPIITNVDAFPEIYGDSLPMVDLPLSRNAPAFRSLVIRALTDKPWRDEVNTKARALAERFTWKKATERMMEVLEAHLARRAAAE